MCVTIGLNRSSWHYRPVAESAENLRLVRLLDEQHLRRPFYGSCNLAMWLSQQAEILNTDQGAQYTARSFIECLERRGIAVSMDSRGRALDNVFIERLWRSVKYECLYLHAFATVAELERGLKDYFEFFCSERPHQSLGFRTPAEV